HYHAAPPPLPLPSFPTRRSSDLGLRRRRTCPLPMAARSHSVSGRDTTHNMSGTSQPCSPSAQTPRTTTPSRYGSFNRDQDMNRQDRRSTRLNSSHVWISYAVFCL